jgi:hypothetical protein
METAATLRRRIPIARLDRTEARPAELGVNLLAIAAVATVAVRLTTRLGRL